MGLSNKTKKKRGYSRRLGLRRRGSGNRGGVGKSGSGKRGKQKKTRYDKREKKKGFKITNKKLEFANLSDIEKDIELKNTRVLAKGELKGKFTIKASYFTKKAKEKIEKSGGKWVEIN